MPRYLNLDKLLPGDVILSSDDSAMSIALRLATGSLTASHAAIAIHPLIWFEAIETGLRYQIITPTLVWDGHRAHIAMEIPTGERYSVRRLADGLSDPTDPTNKHRSAQKLIQACSSYAFLNYASPEAFLNILRFKLGRSAVARFAANNISKRTSKFFPGPFCSWLVAQILSDVGYPIFEKQPNKITPAAIARSKKLTKLDLIFDGEPVETGDRFVDFKRKLDQAVEWAGILTSRISHGAQFVKSVTELNHLIKAHTQAGFRLSDADLPDETKEAFNKIESDQKADFERWQFKAREVVSLAYLNIAPQAEQSSMITQCYARCMKPLNGEPCENRPQDGCYLIGSAATEAIWALWTEFPEFKDPLSGLDDQ